MTEITRLLDMLVTSESETNNNLNIVICQFNILIAREYIKRCYLSDIASAIYNNLSNLRDKLSAENSEHTNELSIIVDTLYIALKNAPDKIFGDTLSLAILRDNEQLLKEYADLNIKYHSCNKQLNEKSVQLGDITRDIDKLYDDIYLQYRSDNRNAEKYQRILDSINKLASKLGLTQAEDLPF